MKENWKRPPSIREVDRFFLHTQPRERQREREHARECKDPRAQKKKTDSSNTKGGKGALLEVRRVRDFGRRDKRFLDTPRLDETVKDRSRSRLVVRARAPRASERLLTDNGTGRLVVVCFPPW